MLQILPKIKLFLFRIFRRSYKKKLFKNLENTIELKLLTSFLQLEKPFFIDVGANKGEFIYTAEQSLQPSQILAFEPLPWFAKKLQVLFPEIKVFQIALSDKEMSTTLYVPLHKDIPDDSLASVNKPEKGDLLTYSVHCQSLDSVLEKSPLSGPIFLKIDVEGHEFSVLNGAQNTLKTTTALLVEIEERHHTGKKLSEMIAQIEKKGFSCYYFHPQKGQLVSFSDDPQIFQRKEDLNTERYINNFWFFAKHLSPETVVNRLYTSIS